MDPRELEKQVKGETSDFTLKERGCWVSELP